jgi:rod shape-determining protein MreD
VSVGPTTRLVARCALVVGSAAVLQVALFSQLPLAGVRVPVLLLVAVAAGVVLGPTRGCVVGFAAGLTFDLLLTTPLGLCAGVFAVTGYVAARFPAAARGDLWWRTPAVAAVASTLAYLAVVLAGWLLAQRPAAPDHLVTVVLVVGAVNGALAPVAVRALRWAGAGSTPATPLAGPPIGSANAR